MAGDVSLTFTPAQGLENVVAKFYRDEAEINAFTMEPAATGEEAPTVTLTLIPSGQLPRGMTGSMTGGSATITITGG